MKMYHSAFKKSVIRTVQVSNSEGRKKKDNQLMACNTVFYTAFSMPTKLNGQTTSFKHINPSINRY
jgi:hypothetical protein